MFDKEEIEAIKKEKNNWEKNYYTPHIKKHPERKEKFENLSKHQQIYPEVF